MTKAKTTGENIAEIIGYIIGISLMGWWLSWVLDNLIEKDFRYWQCWLAMFLWVMIVPKSVAWIITLGLAIGSCYIWFF
jgi:magnesium-transporting ATPase (P-type)